MNLHEYITVSPDIQFGRPVFKGTRVTADTLFFHLEQGISLDDFLQDFPGVSRDQVEGVLESTARLFQSSNIGKLDEIIA